MTRHYLDLGSASDWLKRVVLRGLKWRPLETSAVFSGYVVSQYTIEMCGILLLYNSYIYHVVYWYNNQEVSTNHSAIIFSRRLLSQATHYTTWDVGITLENLVNHSPSARDLISLLVFFQHPAWFIKPINLRNVWYIA